MTSSIQTTLQTTLTGAALAAAFTLGGLTSAHAQLIQPNNEPFPEEQPIIITTDEDEPLDGLTAGLWIYDFDWMQTGHEWVGLKGMFAEVYIDGMWHNFWDIYHDGGKIRSNSWSIDIDRLWVTPNTLSAKRELMNTTIGTFILQVGETNVHNETFGIKTANKEIRLCGSAGQPPAITYGGTLFSSDGVTKDTKIKIMNVAGGEIDKVYFNTGTLENQTYGTIKEMVQYGGTCNNYHIIVKGTLNYDGKLSYGTLNNYGQFDELSLHAGTLNNDGHIDSLTMQDGNLNNTGRIEFASMSGGWLDTRNGYIETLLFHGGVIDGKENIGNIIWVNW